MSKFLHPSSTHFKTKMANVSDKAQDDHLILPPNVLQKIFENMSISDRFFCRRVCSSWRDYLDSEASILPPSSIVVNMNRIHLDEIENLFNESSRKWSRFHFEKMELNEMTYEAIKASSDVITELNIVNCFGPKAFKALKNLTPNLCPNLQKLTLAQMENKLPVFSISIHDFHEYFSLKNLTHLDLSYNTSVRNDKILFSFLSKIDQLVSLNLSGLDLLYQTGNSNNVRYLNFKTLFDDYLTKVPGKGLKKLYLDGSKITKFWLEKLSSKDLFNWETISLLDLDADKLCDAESSAEQLVCNFVKNQMKSLKECHFSIKDSSPVESKDVEAPRVYYFQNIEILEIHDLQFFQNFPKNLKSLKKLITSDNCLVAKISSYSFQNLPQPQKLQSLDIEIIGYEIENEAKDKVNKMRPMAMQDANQAMIIKSMLFQQPESVFPPFKNLLKLSIKNSNGCTGSLDLLVQSVIKSCKLLQSLKLEINGLELTDFGISGMHVNEYDIIQNTTQLKLLKDYYDNYTLTGSQKGVSLSSLKYLKVLSLIKCKDLGMGSFKYGIKFKSLEFLEMTNCEGLGEEGISHIVKNCPSLSYVNISHCPNAIYSPRARKLIKSMPRFKNLNATLTPYVY